MVFIMFFTKDGSFLCNGKERKFVSGDPVNHVQAPQYQITYNRSVQQSENQIFALGIISEGLHCLISIQLPGNTDSVLYILLNK